MATCDHKRGEQVRKACLEVLATRPGAALSADAVRRRVEIAQMVDLPVEEREIDQALEFLKARGLVASRWDALGATTYWEATGDGILHHERGG